VAAIALFLALVAGFAAQRGSICAVAAVKALVVDRKPSRYRAFVECAAWSLAVLATARLLGVAPGSTPSAFPAGATAAVGGALFGVGAAVNGACTFGTVARLGRGDFSYAAMPVGFIAGVIMIARLADAPAPLMDAPDPTQSSLAAMLIVFFVGYQFFRISDVVTGPRDAFSKLTAKEWPPSLAMGVIGVVSGLLMVFFSPWPYSKLLSKSAPIRRAVTGSCGLRSPFLSWPAPLSARVRSGRLSRERPHCVRSLKNFWAGR